MQTSEGLHARILELEHELEAERAQYSRLTSLNAIVQRVAQCLEPAAACAALLDGALALSGAEAGMVLLWDGAGERLFCATHSGLGENFVSKLAQKLADGANSPIVSIARGGEPVLSISGFPYLEHFAELGLPEENIESCIIVPVIAGEQVLGSLALFSSPPHRLSVKELAQTLMVGAQAGFSVSSAIQVSRQIQANEDLLKRRRYLECLAGVSSQLLVASDPWQLIPAIVSWLQQAAEVSRCVYLDVERSAEGELCCKLRTEAAALGVPLATGEAWQAESDPAAFGVTRWLEIVASGNEIVGFVDSFPEDEQLLFLANGTLWLLIVPVIVGNELTGVLGFTMCEPREDLGTGEVALLRSAANALSAAFERVAAESALREAHTLRNNILRGSTEFAILATDIELRVLHCNPVTEQILGFSEELLAGRLLTEVDLLDVGDDAVYAGISRAVDGGGRWEGEFEICDPLGRLRTISLVATGMSTERGEQLGYIIFARDVTELRAEERRTLESQRMESVGRLAGGVAHDFNNILMGVMGYASLAKDRADPRDDVYRMLGVIEQSAERAAALTAQLLAYARGGKLQSVPVKLDDLAEELLDILGTNLPKGVSVTRAFAQRLPYVIADPSQLQQVVMNLCLNAGEAIAERTHLEVRTATKGMITLSTGVLPPGSVELAIDTASRGAGKLRDVVYLRVQDNGCGMDEQTIARIFEPFFTTKFAGRGLGLAAADGIIRNHGGYLDVKSTPGYGSVFTLYLPAAEGISEEEDEEELQQTLGGLETVLVVDDEDVVRQVATLTLTNLGYRVMLAESGPEGIAAFERHCNIIDLVLLDLTMPGMDADDVLARILSIRPNALVLLTSGYDQASAAAQPHFSRTAGFLQKPYTTETLARAVRQVLDQTRIQGNGS